MNKVSIENLIELEPLGEGTHGSVYRTLDRESRKFYALKKVKKYSKGNLHALT